MNMNIKAKIIYPDGSEYDGEQRNGIKNGYGSFRSNKKFAVGMWQNDKLNGKASLSLEQNNQILIYQGTFKDDVLEGSGELSIQQNNEIVESYSGEFHNFQYEGQGLLRNSTYEYQGMFKNNVFNGHGVLKTKHSIYKGQFQNGQKQGQGVEDFGDVEIHGYYFQGCKLGEFKLISQTYSAVVNFDRLENLTNSLSFHLLDQSLQQSQCFDFKLRNKGLFSVIEFTSFLDQFFSGPVISDESSDNGKQKFFDPFDIDYSQFFKLNNQFEIIRNLELNITDNYAKIDFGSNIHYEGQIDYRNLHYDSLENLIVVMSGSGTLTFGDDFLDVSGEFRGNKPRCVKISFDRDQDLLQYANVVFDDQIQMIERYSFKSDQLDFKLDYNSMMYQLCLAEDQIMINGKADQQLEFLTAHYCSTRFEYHLNLLNGEIPDQIVNIDRAGILKNIIASIRFQKIISYTSATLDYQERCDDSLNVLLQSTIQNISDCLIYLESLDQQYSFLPKIFYKYLRTMKNFIQEEQINQISAVTLAMKVTQYAYLGEISANQMNGMGFLKMDDFIQYGIFESGQFNFGFQLSTTFPLYYFGFFQDGNQKNGILFSSKQNNCQCNIEFLENCQTSSRVYINDDQHIVLTKQLFQQYVKNTLVLELQVSQIKQKDWTQMYQQSQISVTELSLIQHMFEESEIETSIEDFVKNNDDIQQYSVDSLQRTSAQIVNSYQFTIQFIQKKQTVLRLLQKYILDLSVLFQISLETQILINVVNVKFVLSVSESQILNTNTTIKVKCFRISIMSGYQSNYLHGDLIDFKVSTEKLTETLTNYQFAAPIEKGECEGEVNMVFHCLHLNATLCRLQGFHLSNISLKYVDGTILNGYMMNNQLNGRIYVERNGICQLDGVANNNLLTDEAIVVQDELNYKGQYFNGKYHGNGILSYKQGELHMEYVGSFYNGKKHGQGVLKVLDKSHTEIRHYQGQFVDDIMNDEQGTCIEIGKYSFLGKILGLQLISGEVQFKNGNIYIGQLYDHQLSGQGKLVDVQQQQSILGQFSNDVPCGNITIIFDPQLQILSSFVNFSFEVQSIAGDFYDGYFVGVVEIIGRNSEKLITTLHQQQQFEFKSMVATGLTSFQNSNLQFDGELLSKPVGNVTININGVKAVEMVGEFDTDLTLLNGEVYFEKFQKQDIEYLPSQLFQIGKIISSFPNNYISKFLKLKGNFAEQQKYTIVCNDNEVIEFEISDYKLTNNLRLSSDENGVTEITYLENDRVNIKTATSEFTGSADFLTYKDGTLSNQNGEYKGEFQNNLLENFGELKIKNHQILRNIVSLLIDFSAVFGAFVFNDEDYYYQGEFDQGQPVNGKIVSANFEIMLLFQDIILNNQLKPVYKILFFKTDQILITNTFCLKNIHTIPGFDSQIKTDSATLTGTIKNSVFIKGIILTKQYEFEGTCINQHFVEGKQIAEKFIYKGQFENNQFSGEGIIKAKNSNEKYVGQWKFGMRNGIGILNQDDGVVMEGLFKDNKLEHGTITYPDQKVVKI